MKFLCLAYGDEAGWKTLSPEEQQKALAHDAIIIDRGDLMSAVETEVAAVTNWDGALEVRAAPLVRQPLPLAGFAVIEADSLDEVVALVANTPCARARGVIEIRALWDAGAQSA